MKIGIIIGSVREGRVGRSVGEWVAQRAAERTEVTYELIDLKEFELPVLASPTHPAQANREYGVEAVNSWGRAIDACDGT